MPLVDRRRQLSETSMRRAFLTYTKPLVFALNSFGRGIRGGHFDKTHYTAREARVGDRRRPADDGASRAATETEA